MAPTALILVGAPGRDCAGVGDWVARGKHSCKMDWKCVNQNVHILLADKPTVLLDGVGGGIPVTRV